MDEPRHANDSATEQVVPFALNELSTFGARDPSSKVAVQIRFGKCRVNDRPDYCAGDIINLDEDESAPIELVHADRVIAWGHLVTRDGKLGLQIEQVLRSGGESDAA